MHFLSIYIWHKKSSIFGWKMSIDNNITPQTSKKVILNWLVGRMITLKTSYQHHKKCTSTKEEKIIKLCSTYTSMCSRRPQEIDKDIMKYKWLYIAEHMITVLGFSGIYIEWFIYKPMIVFDKHLIWWFSYSPRIIAAHFSNQTSTPLFIPNSEISFWHFSSPSLWHSSLTSCCWSITLNPQMAEVKLP